MLLCTFQVVFLIDYVRSFAKSSKLYHSFPAEYLDLFSWWFFTFYHWNPRFWGLGTIFGGLKSSFLMVLGSKGTSCDSSPLNHHHLGEDFIQFFQPPNNQANHPDDMTWLVRKVCFPSGMRNILQSPSMLAIASWSFLVKSCRAWNSSRRSKRWVERYCWWFKNPAFTSSGW